MILKRKNGLYLPGGGNDECQITEACKKIEQLGPDIIDINMGCSVSDIAERVLGLGCLNIHQRSQKCLIILPGLYQYL
ncbi:tRNA-dihydrouridine synthase [Candidatus Kuenenia stuttgartensis]|uniref:tRNA-dihydrouridine synthase n=1 Tax=Kuenenia stuttgartiensis TaxID=174633 RepID=UPI003B969AEC